MPPNPKLTEIWVYLAASPLLGLSITLAAYQMAYGIYKWGKANPLLNPVAIAVGLLIALLSVTHTSYFTYFEGAQFVHFLLGPATVSLAIPLYKQLAKLRRLWLPVALALVVGISSAALSAIAIAVLLGATPQTLLSLAPKSVTAPVAMGITEKVGGLPSLTAVLVVMTGIIGATIGTRIFKWLGIRDDSIRGIALGITSHGIGTARAFQVSPEMGAFAGLGMALSAFVSAALLPWLLQLLNLGT